MIFESRGRFDMERGFGTGCAKIAPTAGKSASGRGAQRRSGAPAVAQEHQADEPGEPNDQQQRKDRQRRVWGQVCMTGLASTA